MDLDIHFSAGGRRVCENLRAEERHDTHAEEYFQSPFHCPDSLFEFELLCEHESVPLN